MIAITIFEDTTQIVATKKKKDKLEVKSLISFRSMYEAYTSKNVDALTSCFMEIAALIKDKEAYIVLPDDKFRLDYYYYPTNSEKEADIDKFLKANAVDTEKYYYSLPFSLKSNTFSFKTVYSIEKEYIDAVLQAAKAADFLVKSAEPMSFCAVRYKNTPKNEAYIFELYKNSASVIMYSPLGGLFKMNLSKEYALNNLSGYDLSDLLLMVNTVAKNKFKNITGSADIYVIGAKSSVSKITFAHESSRVYKLRPNGSLIFKKYTQTEIDEYYIGLGTLLQEFEVTPVKFIKFTVANVLPNAVKETTKLIQIEQDVKKITRVLILFFTFVITVQAVFVYYLSGIEVPDKLQNDFDYANRQITILKKEDGIIQNVKKSQEPVGPIISEILANKPNNNELGFTKLSIDNTVTAKNSSDWIKMSLVSTEPVKIQEFVSNLSNDRFKSITLTKMDNAASAGINSADISIAKDIKETKKNTDKKKE